MTSHEKGMNNLESLDISRKREAITKLREELKILTDSGILVIDLEKWIQEGHLPLGEQGDILIDAMPDQVDNVKQYLVSENDYTIIKHGPGPRHDTGGGYWFVLKLHK